MKKVNVLLMVLLTLSFSLLMVNCEGETETITETDTVYVEVEPSFAVAVSVADDGEATTNVGGTITLVAEVTSDAAMTSVEKFWNTDGGMLSASAGDTAVWTAPETEGTYTVTVHANDGEMATAAAINVGAGAYVAVADTYFVGGATCAGCHSGTNTNWAETGHAEAWETLQNSGHPASYCNRCHTVDFEETAGNAGYDDVPVAAFENVQCESCHGPGSAHRGAPSSDNIVVDIAADNCTTCHSGAHHPFNTDWVDSKHAWTDDAEAAHGAPTRSYCQPCHSGSGFIAEMKPAGSVEFNADAPGNISCAVCHDPHDATNHAQLRGLDLSITSIEANGTTDVIEMAGAGQLCAQCHHARRSADTQIDEGYAHFGPHGSPQSDMVAGISAYNFDGTEKYDGYKSGHYVIENSCTSCHMEATPYPDAYTGHTFNPTTSSCGKCHGEIDSFEAVMASGDYDGDGAVEGLQLEVEGLVHTLGGQLISAGLDTTGTDFLGALSATMDDTLADGSQKAENIKLRKGGYNLAFVEDDKSMGIHNPEYTVQILQASVNFMNAKALSSAKILKSGEKATTF